ncbi:glyoxylate/hydroxypyruvate reductase A [Roseibium sp. RKSG952]|nr:glyoxylate/hydroxypyruvate reductase A [Roseibium sp. RKSG952]MTH96718.1 glyoxylate/hydroxypyruvate reductase A [Roseibium sp. RKSG952]
MSLVIPFVFRPHSRENWDAVLAEELKHIGTIKPFDALSDTERRAARFAIVANPDPQDVARLPNLEWVQSLWAGVERLTAELPADGPRIVRLADPQMAVTMSEAVLAWTLYLHRDMPRYARQQSERRWKEHALITPDQRRIGILGLGALGQAAALRLRANGFRVSGWSRSPKSVAGVDCFHGQNGLEEVLARSGILVLLMPLTSETRGLVNAGLLARLPKGASLINFARGPIVDDTALIEALDAGHLSHAVLDVFSVEPLPAGHPYWSHPAVTVLPHISAPTLAKSAVAILAENIAAYLKTGNIPDSVDRKRGY